MGCVLFTFTIMIGLFFGSFNPIHNGHLIIANCMQQYASLKQVWFIVSPQNPFKEKSGLMNQYDRLHLVKLAIEDNSRFKASDIEFSLPQPSYTINTLTYLTEKYPTKKFALIMGSDNLVSFHKWKNADVILKNYPLLVYNRRGFTTDQYNNNPSVSFFSFPLLDVSSSDIRQMIQEKKSVRYLLPEKVLEYVSGSSLLNKINPK